MIIIIELHSAKKHEKEVSALIEGNKITTILGLFKPYSKNKNI